MNHEAVFANLNPEQRRAVEAVRGPVCILAGAGSGKTTTITRRIANQVLSGAFRADEILAVTFTDKAAGEMRARLAALGATGVRAQTFHAAALGQLHANGGPPGQILPSKAVMLVNIARVLPRPYRFRPVGDLATEIEWAKNRRIAATDYEESLGARKPPIPADLMASVYREYERRKTAAGRIDFEDLLERTIALLEEDDHARAGFHERYAAFTVDEYQDVNLLQQTLLDLWLGGRDELAVVGDDYQSIYGFTGATPRYLLDVPRRFPDATVVRLETNYRSTPEILELANRLVPRLEGAEKELRASRPPGPAPVVLALDGAEETAFVVDRVRELASDGVPLGEIAVLYRTNARSAGFEQAFTEAEIPFQVREGGFLTRQAARRVKARLKSSQSVVVAASIREAASREGLLAAPPKELGEQERVRQADLARLVDLAERFDDGERTVADFFADLEERFGRAATAQAGVQLLTYHRAKGLEFEAVFLPRLEEKELPIRQAKEPEEIAEERRLFYVGSHAREATALPDLVGDREAEPVPRRARGRGAAEATARTEDRRGHADDERAAPVAARTGEGGRRPRVRRHARHDARRASRAAPVHEARARVRPGDRPGEARPVRRRSSRHPRGRRSRLDDRARSGTPPRLVAHGGAGASRSRAWSSSRSRTSCRSSSSRRSCSWAQTARRTRTPGRAPWRCSAQRSRCWCSTGCFGRSACSCSRSPSRTSRSTTSRRCTSGSRCRAEDSFGLPEDSWRAIWIVAYVPLLLVTVVLLIAVARSAIPRVRRFILAGLGLLGLALAAEASTALSLGGLTDGHAFDAIEIAFEEGAELVGWILVAAALTAHMAWALITARTQEKRVNQPGQP